MIDLTKLNEIATIDEKWLQEATQRRDNRNWQSHSKKIASRILVTLRERQMKQLQLAEAIGVSAQQINKIVKGNENLTLETIAKLENALNISLLFVENEKTYIIKQSYERKQYIYIPVFVSKSDKIAVKQAFNKEWQFDYCKPDKNFQYEC